jgi:hypothetical protein
VKIAFRVVLALTMLPVALGLSGMCLAWYFDCSGMDHIERCEPGAPTSLIFPLVAFVWISIFAVPAGLLVFALLGLARLIHKMLTGRADAA